MVATWSQSHNSRHSVPRPSPMVAPLSYQLIKTPEKSFTIRLYKIKLKWKIGIGFGFGIDNTLAPLIGTPGPANAHENLGRLVLHSSDSLMDSTQPSNRMEPRSRTKSASCLARIGDFNGETKTPSLSLGFLSHFDSPKPHGQGSIPSSPPFATHGGTHLLNSA